MLAELFDPVRRYASNNGQHIRELFDHECAQFMTMEEIFRQRWTGLTVLIEREEHTTAV